MTTENNPEPVDPQPQAPEPTPPLTDAQPPELTPSELGDRPVDLIPDIVQRSLDGSETSQSDQQGDDDNK